MNSQIEDEDGALFMLVECGRGDVPAGIVTCHVKLNGPKQTVHLLPVAVSDHVELKKAVTLAVRDYGMSIADDFAGECAVRKLGDMEFEIVGLKRPMGADSEYDDVGACMSAQHFGGPAPAGFLFVV